MTSHMFLRLIPSHFYLQCSGWASRTVPCHFVNVIDCMFCVLKLIVEQIIYCMIYTGRSMHSSCGRNRFHFQLKQQANEIENKQTPAYVIGATRFLLLFCSFIWELELFRFFSSSTHISPQTIQPSHYHPDTHSHSSCGCSLSERNATCICYLWTTRKGKATPDPWQPRTSFAAEVLPLLTLREGANAYCRRLHRWNLAVF